MAALRKKTARRKLAERFRRFRIDRKITQGHAAKVLRIYRSTLCLIESGKQSIPAERLVDFAKVVSVDVAELLGVNEEIEEKAAA